jgi:pyrroloquinoline quinone (PQQ) biosynthesis protein C
MNIRFERTGPIEQLSSYPIWAQDMIADCESTKRSVVGHELFAMMREARLDEESTANFMIGIWPVIERFPGYMAMNLLKTSFGRSDGDNLARRWLVRNIRVEQNHAEYWLNWAEGEGIARDRVLKTWVSHEADALANWCEEVSRSGTLAAGIAATNYAVEGATGEWSQLVYDSTTYRNHLPAESRTGSLRWLQLHAAYDDTHPWEALEIVCTLLGLAPAAHEVAHIAECVKRTYTAMRMLADRCVAPHRIAVPVEVAA